MADGQYVLITNMIAPYRIPLFNELARQYPDFFVVFLRERENYRLWKIPRDEIHFNYVVLAEHSGVLHRVRRFFRINILQVLHSRKPTAVIIGGWSDLENWAAFLYCKFSRIPTILWSGQTLESSRIKSWPANLIRRIFIQANDAYISYGTAAARTLQSYGAPPDKIAVGYNVGDVEFFSHQVSLYRKTPQYLEERKRWVHPTLLYVGQLIERKGLFSLLQALRIIGTTQPWNLIIAGGGPQEAELKQFCGQFGLSARVFFIDYVQRNEIAQYFAVADFFILPSIRDQGAIVLSEALASGLFVLGSQYDGIASDLIRPDCNGILIDPQNIDTLSHQIQSVLNRYYQQSMQNEQASSLFMGENPVQKYVGAFNKAIQQVGRRSSESWN